MVQSTGFSGSEDQFTLIEGNRYSGRKEYDNRLVNLLSITHLSKEPFPQRRNAFNGRRSADFALLGARSWKEHWSIKRPDSGPDSLFYEQDSSLLFGARKENCCSLEGQTHHKEPSDPQDSPGACGRDKSCLAWSVELTPVQHQFRCLHPPPLLHTGPRRGSVTQVSKADQGFADHHQTL